jgi:hypothetical protein
MNGSPVRGEGMRRKETRKGGRGLRGWVRLWFVNLGLLRFAGRGRIIVLVRRNAGGVFSQYARRGSRSWHNRVLDSRPLWSKARAGVLFWVTEFCNDRS